MDIKRSKLLQLCSLSFVAGIAFASYSTILPKTNNTELYLFAILAFLLVWLIIYRGSRFVRVSVLLGAFFVFGVWRLVLATHHPTVFTIDNYNGQAFLFKGVVIDEPFRATNYQKYEIEAYEAVLGGKKRPVSGKVLVYGNRYHKIEYGDSLLLDCRLEAPEKFSDFDYDLYLSQFDIYSICYFPSFERIAGGQGNYFYAKIINFKQDIKELISFSCEEPASSVLSAMVIGDKSGLDKEMKDVFSRAGISHIVAISGMHIGILIFILNQTLLFAGLKRRLVFWLVSFLLFLYVILIGMTASALRAGIMGFLVLLALQLGRINKITNTLYLAAAALLLFNPLSLRSDVGFQLSFLAVVAIIYIFPFFKEFFDKIKIPGLAPILDIFALTLSVQLLTMPVIINNFGMISLVSPLTNILVVPFLPFLLIMSFAAILLGFLAPYFGWLFFAPAAFLANYIIFIAEKLSGLSFSSLSINGLSLIYLCSYYGFLLLILSRKKFNFSLRRFVI